MAAAALRQLTVRPFRYYSEEMKRDRELCTPSLASEEMPRGLELCLVLQRASEEMNRDRKLYFPMDGPRKR